MRIDSNFSIARVMSIRPRSGVKANAAADGASLDSVELSARAQDLRVALDALKEAPPVREELVATLRRQIEQGSFDANAEAVARKLLGLRKQSAGDE